LTEVDPTFLEPVLQPVIAWMSEHNTPSLHIKATAPKPIAVLDRPGDESEFLFYEEFTPNSGQTDVYNVVDRESGGRLDGPSAIPMALLGPLLSELSKHDVDELRVAALPGTSPTSDAPGKAANHLTAVAPAVAPGEFEEHIDPVPGPVSGIVAFLLDAGDDDGC
jgi:hypothetical protein